MAQIDKKTRKLLRKFLQGDSEACRKLGIRFWKVRGCKRDRKLAKFFLVKSMDMGNQKAYFTYHRLFSKGKKVIDDKSYEAMCREYNNITDWKRKKELEKYLELGTKRQIEDCKGRGADWK